MQINDRITFILGFSQDNLFKSMTSSSVDSGIHSEESVLVTVDNFSDIDVNWRT